MTENVLVTGGNGFLAEQIIKKLLINGYTVRATVRSLDKQTGVLETLKQAQVPNLEQLSFVKADLTTDADWPAAMKDINYVMSVAAPVFVNGETVSSEVSEAAKNGILRIIKAAEKAGVKRVVMTANLGAVSFSTLDTDRVVTETDWTDPDQPGLSLYEKSKLVAEEAAWDYLKASHSSLEFTTVNAGAMLGPSLGGHVSGSFGLVSQLLDGSLKRVPDLPVNIVDVRDVADIHVRAMQTPAAAGQRFLAVEDQPMTLREICALVREQRPALAGSLPTKNLPTWLLQLASRFNQQAKEANLMRRTDHNVSNQKARTVLGWQPISNTKEAVLAAVDSLQKAN